MSNEENWRLQVSYKTPSGDLINIRANTADELSINLESIGDYATQIASVQAKIAGAFVALPLSTPSSTTATTQEQSSPQAQVAVASVTQVQTGPTCEHGAKKHLKGVSKKTGQPYDFWACPMPQGQQCG